MKNGFSLVELVLALVLFQVGILATAGMVLLAQRNLLRAEVIMKGIFEADLVADSLGRSGENGSGRRRYSWGEVSWTPTSDQLGGLTVVAFSFLLGDTLVALRAWSPQESTDPPSESLPYKAAFW